MAVKHCLVTGDPLTPENNALAHIIPNSIGGKLKYRGLISHKGNEILNRKLDVGIGNAYRNIMAAVDGKRERGENRPAEVWTSSGAPSYFRLGEPIRRKDPVIQYGPNGLTILERGTRDARRTTAALPTDTRARRAVFPSDHAPHPAGRRPDTEDDTGKLTVRRSTARVPAIPITAPSRVPIIG
jgi:hypothetical protein